MVSIVTGARGSRLINLIGKPTEDLIILMNGDAKPIIMKNAKDESLIQLILPIKTY